MTRANLHGLVIIALVLAAAAHARNEASVRRQYVGDGWPVELRFASFLDFVAPWDLPNDHVALEHVADAVGIRYVANGQVDPERLQRIRTISGYLQGVRAAMQRDKRRLEADILCRGNRGQTADQVARSVNGVDDAKEGVARKYFQMTLRYLEPEERAAFESYLDEYDSGTRTVIDARVVLEDRYGELPTGERDQALRAALTEFCARLAADGFVTK